MKTEGNSFFPFHYGWLIVFSGTLCMSACLGFGRFALGMLLPSMSQTLGLNYVQMGLVGTSNFTGYLIAVLASGILAGRTGARKTIFSALMVVGVSMMLISQAKSYLYLLVLYFITGIGSGAANVPMMGLVAAWFDKRQRGRAAGFVVIGSGFAIIISGKLIPFVNRMAGSEGWRVNWLVLGSLVTIIAFVCLALIRNRPEEKGLRPFGSVDDPCAHPATKALNETSIYRENIIYLLGAIYFLFGYTYVIYATFIVTTLIKERGLPESAAGNFWAWVGLLSLFSGPVFGTLSDRLSRKTGLMIVFSFQVLAYLLAASGLPVFSLYLSVFFYGIVAWSIPSIMVAAVSDYVGAAKTTAAFGFITFIFGIGQIAGPAAAGLLAQMTGSFSGSYYMAAAFAGAAILLATFLKK